MTADVRLPSFVLRQFTTTMTLITNALVQALMDIETFSRTVLKRPLRAYQAGPAKALIASVIRRDGEQYVWRFPRQSGKNETVAHVHAYLLFLYQRVKGATIVHTAPTFDPQCKNAMRRLVEITSDNAFFKDLRAAGNTVSLGQARIIFLSGMERDKPNVGSTASLLLSKDECQDLDAEYIERAFDPMTADTNAPHLLTGTARHTGTYLAQKRVQLERLQAEDGKQRVFIAGWREVAAVNPAYGHHVEQVISRLGALHPVVQTEYENVETEQTGRLFDERRLGLIYNTTIARTHTPERAQGATSFGAVSSARNSAQAQGATSLRNSAHNAIYVATIDVGGADLLQENREHDFTVAAIHRVTFDDAETSANALPTFTTVEYLAMQGANVLDDTPDRRRLFAFLDTWRPARIVTDATGLGVGLASALLNRYQARVIPFHFTGASKTELLNQWLALIETGRYRHYQALASGNGSSDLDYARMREQMARCEHTEKATRNGAAQHTEWGVPAVAYWRNPHTLADELLHDDHLLAVAMVGVLAEADLRPHTATSTPAPRRLAVDD